MSSASIERADIAIVGGGASGLAAGAAMKRRGIEPVILERDDRIGGTWARRYEKLRLHTTQALSGLPFHPLPRGLPRYVTKDDYARYLAHYAERLRLPVVLDRCVDRIRPASDGPGWVVETQKGDFRVRAVVVATGKHNVPFRPRWKGEETFLGTILHSAEYRRGKDFTGRRVLVVGIGNSGAEIATDLAESGAARVAIAVRKPPPITSREILGVPIQVLGILLAPFPPRWVDRLGKALRRFSNGDLSRYGLGREAWGPFTARRPPVIDVGFLAQLKRRQIDVVPIPSRLTRRGAVFADGRIEDFDAIVWATGFTSGLDRLLDAPGALDERAFPLCGEGGRGSRAGLFFIGFNETPRGALFEANRDARHLARRVERYLREGPTQVALTTNGPGRSPGPAVGVHAPA